MFSSLKYALIETMSAIPTPTPEAPPGAQKFLIILNWASWAGLVICVLGVISVGIAMAINWQRNEGGEHAKRLGIVLLGAVLIGAASGIVAAVTS